MIRTPDGARHAEANGATRPHTQLQNEAKSGKNSWPDRPFF